LPTAFRGEAMSMAVFIVNRSPTKALKDKTVFEAWYGWQRTSPFSERSSALAT
jgi:hypothetical protein